MRGWLEDRTSLMIEYLDSLTILQNLLQLQEQYFSLIKELNTFLEAIIRSIQT